MPSAAFASAPPASWMAWAASATASPPPETPRRPSADATRAASRSSATPMPMDLRLSAGCLSKWTAVAVSMPVVCAYASTAALTAGVEDTAASASAGDGAGTSRISSPLRGVGGYTESAAPWAAL